VSRSENRQRAEGRRRRVLGDEQTAGDAFPQDGQQRLRHGWRGLPDGQQVDAAETVQIVFAPAHPEHLAAEDNLTLHSQGRIGGSQRGRQDALHRRALRVSIKRVRMQPGNKSHHPKDDSTERRN